MSFSSQRGITLIEITIVMTVMAILTAAAAPIASRTVDRARATRALDDAKAIRTALLAFLSELPGYQGPKVDGTSNGSTAIQLLVSDGDIASDPLDGRWDDPVGNSGGGSLICDFIENHLVQNEPFDDPTKLYPITTPAGNVWRGAYLSSPVDPDPWGNRYMVNVQWLQGTATERKNDVVVLSAGPNESVDTLFEVDGITPGDDDTMVVVRRDPGLTVP
jgi:prepilin-type N-terminal cleavage/methylation domain-containing protein